MTCNIYSTYSVCTGCKQLFLNSWVSFLVHLKTNTKFFASPKIACELLHLVYEKPTACKELLPANHQSIFTILCCNISEVPSKRISGLTVIRILFIVTFTLNSLQKGLQNSIIFYSCKGYILTIQSKLPVEHSHIIRTVCSSEILN